MSETLDRENSFHHCVGMVVDDDDLLRESVVAILEDLFDEVYQASDGVEGLRVLEDHPDISLVITDITMPRLDGIGFAHQARQSHPGLKVLFVSGVQRPPSRERFLLKPFRRGALLSELQSLLTRPQA